MSTVIKQLGAGPEVDRRILARERDLVDQINRSNTSLASRVEAIETFMALLLELGRPVASGRITTNGIGGITVNQTNRCTVTLTGGNQRVTFETERPLVNATPHYTPLGIAITGSGRYYAATNYQAAFFDFVLRNDAAGAVDPATNAIAMAFVVLDWD